MGIIGVVLGLALGAFALLGLVAAFDGAMTSQRSQTVLSTLVTMETSIRRAHANLPEYEAELTAGLLSQMPANAVQDGYAAMPGASADTRRIVTPWGGFIYAGGGDTADNQGLGADSGNRFYITVLDLPEAACEIIAKAYLNSSSVVQVAAEGTAATAATAEQTTGAAIDAECDGDDDDKVGIVFRG